MREGGAKMREIYFRGKGIRCPNEGQWLYGYYTLERSAYSDNPNDLNHCIREQCGISNRVDPTTVGQFTGLTDRNGKRIYEGDLVTIPNSSRPGLPGEVHWYKRVCAYAIRRIEYSSIPLDDYTEYEIVGNIHDNPELIQ